MQTEQQGWHRDPFGRFAMRYHDGTDWTEHVSDGSGAASVDPSGTKPHVDSPLPGPPPGHATAAAAPAGASPFTGLPGNPLLRFLARVIDGIILGLPLYLLLDATIGLEMNLDAEGEDPEVSTGAYVVMGLVYLAYEVWMVGTYGRTIGKMAMGLTIVRRSTGALPGYPIAFVRLLAWLIYGVPVVGQILFIVTIVMGFSGSQRQTIHDKVAGTVVAKSSTLRG